MTTSQGIFLLCLVIGVAFFSYNAQRLVRYLRIARPEPLISTSKRRGSAIRSAERSDRPVKSGSVPSGASSAATVTAVAARSSASFFTDASFWSSAALCEGSTRLWEQYP